MTPHDRVGGEEANHETSLAVWDLPSPLVINRPSTVKVGVKCAAGCEISGGDVEIRDEAGGTVARARLGPTPWPGTNGLYWAEVGLVAPGAEGTYCWTVRFMNDDPERPHRDSSSSLHFVAVKPPDHRVTVKVLASGTADVLGDVEIRVAHYRARTDAAGLGGVDVPKGAHEVHAWKAGYESTSRTIVVDEDVTLCLELTASPDAELEYWR